MCFTITYYQLHCHCSALFHKESYPSLLALVVLIYLPIYSLIYPLILLLLYLLKTLIIFGGNFQVHAACVRYILLCRNSTKVKSICRHHHHHRRCRHHRHHHHPDCHYICQYLIFSIFIICIVSQTLLFSAVPFFLANHFHTPYSPPNFLFPLFLPPFSLLSLVIFVPAFASSSLHKCLMTFMKPQ